MNRASDRYRSIEAQSHFIRYWRQPNSIKAESQVNNLKEIVCGNKTRYCIKTYDGQSSLFLLAKCNSNTVSNEAYQTMGSNNFRKGGKAAKGGYQAKQTTSSTSNAKKTKKSLADYSYELGIKHQRDRKSVV